MTLDFSDVDFDITKGVAPSGGEGGTTDHSQLTNLSYNSSGHTGFMSNENYLPHGTVINVKTDGTGDFTNLNDALEYLKGKFSNGQITIQFGEGTFTHSANTTINGSNMNFTALIIKGMGANETTLEYTTTAVTACITVAEGVTVFLQDLTIKRPTGTSSTDYRGVNVIENSMLRVLRLNIEGCNYALNIGGLGKIYLVGTINISDSNIAIITEGGGTITSAWSPTINFKNCNKAVHVNNGGKVNISNSATITFTNVTTKTNQAVGTATNMGWITGTGLN